MPSIKCGSCGELLTLTRQEWRVLLGTEKCPKCSKNPFVRKDMKKDNPLISHLKTFQHDARCPGPVGWQCNFCPMKFCKGCPLRKTHDEEVFGMKEIKYPTWGAISTQPVYHYWTKRGETLCGQRWLFGLLSIAPFEEGQRGHATTTMDDRKLCKKCRTKFEKQRGLKNGSQS